MDLTKNRYSSHFLKQNEKSEFWVMELGKYEYGPFDDEKDAKTALEMRKKQIDSEVNYYTKASKDKSETEADQSHYSMKAKEMKDRLGSLRIKKL